MRSIFLAFGMLPFVALSQFKSQDTVLKYLDSNLSITTKINASFIGIALKSDDHWLLYALYSDTTPVIKAFYKDKKLTVKDGPYTIYYPNKNKIMEGYYLNNKLNATWKFYYENGQLKDSGAFKDNQMIGEWMSWYPNGQIMIKANYTTVPEESTGTIYSNEAVPIAFKNGPFSSWYADGNLEASGSFVNNTIDGEWKWYHDNGKPSTIEIYKNGKINSLTCFDSTGKNAGDYCSIQKPAVLKKYGNYKEFIYQNLAWPEEAIKKKIEGTVKVRFTVNKEGKLEKLEVEGEQEILKKAVMELFKSMPEWYPAISHNRPIAWSDEMEIPFYRQ
jgi:TonB family protein